MSPALANFLFEVANFVVLAVGLGWLLFKPVRKMLVDEQKRRADLEARSEKLRTEAEALLAEAKARHRALEEELSERQAKARSEAREAADAIIQEAKEREARELKAAEARLEALSRAQSEQLSGLLGEIAARSVERLMETLDGPSLNRALARGALEQLATLPEEKRRSATVQTELPLDDELRRELKEALSGPFEVRQVPDLGPGLRVLLPGGQVDATVHAIAREAAREVHRRLQGDARVAGGSSSEVAVEPSGGEEGPRHVDVSA